MPFLLLIIIILFPLISCKKQEAPPAKQTRVSATRAYERYFGPAPTSDKGTCFAFVIYFPSAKAPGKVVPFPFFTFDEGSLKKVAVERLIGGMDVTSYAAEFLPPFPAGTRLLSLTEQGGTVTATFSPEVRRLAVDTPAGKGSLRALSLTLAQFAGVKEVRFVAEGEGALPKPVPDESAVLEPAAPRLLSVTAVKDKGSRDIEGVDAYFDRPVDIRGVTISDREGKPFAGQVYQSVFDMAAVLKPDDPSLFKAGMPVRVRWQVKDKVGRSAEGDREFSLEVKEH